MKAAPGSILAQFYLRWALAKRRRKAALPYASRYSKANLPKFVKI